MKNQFEIEQAIMECWKIVDDANLIRESIVEGDLPKHMVINYLLGLNAIYQLKFERLFGLFEDAIKND